MYATPLAMVARMFGGVQGYAWGSHTMMSRLRGLPPSVNKEAELWLGTHPLLPSRLEGGEPLPESLPFLFKILTAEEPLSIQTHPSKAQAEAGFAREEALGMSRTDAKRNYKDDNHKPELICALTDFHALCGFRAPVEAEAMLLLVADSAMRDLLQPFSLRRALQQLLQADRAVVARSVAHAVAAKTNDNPAFDWMRRLAKAYPSDPGVLVSLLLNYVKLAPGEALYLPAGNLHAYLHGAGVEVMATSDNVLRGGLTPKHVDVEELLKVTQVAPLAPPLLRVQPGEVTVYRTPFAEFELQRLAPGGKRRIQGAAIVWSEQAATVEHLSLGACESAFIASGESAEVVAGGPTYVCSCPVVAS